MDVSCSGNALNFYLGDTQFMDPDFWQVVMANTFYCVFFALTA
jgi:hypothetical protein